MNTLGKVAVWSLPLVALMVSGCAAPTVDFTTLERPGRAPELDAYEVFVGQWVWEAEMVNAEGPDRHWTGTATWDWVLDGRYLHGQMSARSANASFEAAGTWSWHPTEKKHKWWMFNNWGYPQEGTATYDVDSRCWCMRFTSVGLDGTPSFGRYTMRVIDNDTLEWRVQEWADMAEMFPKMEMRGTYKRK
ncbi:MAG: DUF1579 domain-containing protein [bacterium]|nr:DUF1579 domain-containing protein [bacterium]